MWSVQQSRNRKIPSNIQLFFGIYRLFAKPVLYTRSQTKLNKFQMNLLWILVKNPTKQFWFCLWYATPKVFMNRNPILCPLGFQLQAELSTSMPHWHKSWNFFKTTHSPTWRPYWRETSYQSSFPQAGFISLKTLSYSF